MTKAFLLGFFMVILGVFAFASPSLAAEPITIEGPISAEDARSLSSALESLESALLRLDNELAQSTLFEDSEKETVNTTLDDIENNLVHISGNLNTLNVAYQQSLLSSQDTVAADEDSQAVTIGSATPQSPNDSLGSNDSSQTASIFQSLRLSHGFTWALLVLLVIAAYIVIANLWKTTHTPKTAR